MARAHANHLGADGNARIELRHCDAIARSNHLLQLAFTLSGLFERCIEALELELVPAANTIEQFAALGAVHVDLPDNLAKGDLPRPLRREKVALGVL